MISQAVIYIYFRDSYLNHPIILKRGLKWSNTIFWNCLNGVLQMVISEGMFSVHLH